jgi:hypothetical protein
METTQNKLQLTINDRNKGYFTFAINDKTLLAAQAHICKGET